MSQYKVCPVCAYELRGGISTADPNLHQSCLDRLQKEAYREEYAYKQQLEEYSYYESMEHLRWEQNEG